MTAIIVGTRSYFRGYSFTFSVLWGLLGALSSIIPIMILKYLNVSGSNLFNVSIVLMTLVYMLICHLTDFRGDQKADAKLINEVLDDDIKSNLLEPLFYTFKTKSYRYKGSKFGMLDDVNNQIRSISGESVAHYILWSLMAALVLLELVFFGTKTYTQNIPEQDNIESVENNAGQLENDAK